ncbi:MAG: D-alanine--D-alanine ligase [Ignavibacteriae bacterium]|nr:D-alanine--D-alanine ligase [Ignavibacteriota bacterium]
MKVAVLFGGISPERNVSIKGGLAVIKALQEIGHEVIPIDPAFGVNGKLSVEEIISPANSISLEELTKYNPKNIIDCINSELFDDIDIAFIVLHGQYGEDGKIQALLELRGIPYTGSNIKASAVGIDKLASKMMFLAAGISTPQWMTVRQKDFNNYDYFEDIRSELGGNLVIKPNDQGSTIGITIVEDGNLDEINHGVDLASKYSEIVIVEQYIEGREIHVGIVGGEALPLIEIIPEEGFYDYEHKYTKGKTEYICPAEVTDDIAEFIQNQALTAYNIVGCSGFARADFRLNDEGLPFLLEINTIPGFTETSLVPMAAREIGIEFPELCDRIIQQVFNKNNHDVETEE